MAMTHQYFPMKMRDQAASSLGSMIHYISPTQYVLTGDSYSEK